MWAEFSDSNDSKNRFEWSENQFEWLLGSGIRFKWLLAIDSNVFGSESNDFLSSATWFKWRWELIRMTFGNRFECIWKLNALIRMMLRIDSKDSWESIRIYSEAQRLDTNDFESNLVVSNFSSRIFGRIFGRNFGRVLSRIFRQISSRISSRIVSSRIFSRISSRIVRYRRNPLLAMTRIDWNFVVQSKMSTTVKFQQKSETNDCK